MVGAGARSGAGAGAAAKEVLGALARASRPLRTTDPRGDLGDLRPLGAALGRAPVVGLGEVAHGARELYRLKHRVFRYLAQEKGFTTFALETGWAAGVRIDAYVRHGEGDPRALLEREFGGGAWPWHVHEYLDLVTWMRAHNARGPRTPLRFMGNDLAHPRIDDLLFERVARHVARRHPSLLARIGRLHHELRAHADDFATLPRARRLRLAGQARRAVQLLRERQDGGAEHAWATQHARVLCQTATLLAYDLEDPRQIPEAMRYRDELMARNTVWWHRHTGEKVLLSAHNGHTAYETYEPESYPVTQGAYMRRMLGRRYLGVGTTFGHGATTVPGDDGRWVTERFGPPRAGSTEHTLDRVGEVTGSHDWILDLGARSPRAARPPLDPVARAWLDTVRATRDVGPPGDPYRPYALGRGHDVLVHLRALSPARRLR